MTRRKHGCINMEVQMVVLHLFFYVKTCIELHHFNNHVTFTFIKLLFSNFQHQLQLQTQHYNNEADQRHLGLSLHSLNILLIKSFKMNKLLIALSRFNT